MLAPEKRLVMGEEKKNEKITNGDGHVLTEAEIRRLDAFEEKEKKLIEKGYKRQDIVISVLTANVVGILLTIPFAGAIVAGYILRNGKPFKPEILDTQPALYFGALAGIIVVSLVLTFLHEKIHGWFWTIGAENGAKDIEFGFQKETLTPYCTCASPLSKSIYILGSMMPMTILGIVLGIVSIFVGFFPLLVVAVIQVIGGAGDILISAMLLFRKTKDKDIVLLDHPTKIGLVAFEKEKEAK
jgi:hypothetical protein